MSDSMLIASHPNAFNNIPVVKKIGNKNMESFTNMSVDQRRVLVQISPTTSISSNVLAGASIDFRVENPVDKIGTAYIRVDWTNSSGAACVHSGPTDMWLQGIQIFSNNGSTLLYQTNDPVSNYFINNVLMSRDEHEATATLRGTSAAAYASGTISDADGTSGSYYISLAPNFWRSTHLRTYTIDGNLLVRIQFQPAANIITSGTFTTTAVYLMFTGYMESDRQKQLMLQRAEKPKAFSYYAPQSQIETLTLAASSVYNLRLSGINGWCNQLFIGIRAIANATSPNNQFSFSKPASIDVLDASSKSLTGFKSQSAADLTLLYSHMYQNVFCLFTNGVFWSWSQTPTADIATGSWNGGVHLNGFNVLQFTTASGLVGGSYQIIVCAMCNETVLIESALAKSTRH